jgi:hypothetical protein
MTPSDLAHLNEIIATLMEIADDEGQPFDRIAVRGQLPGLHLATLTTLPELQAIVARGLPN